MGILTPNGFTSEIASSQQAGLGSSFGKVLSPPPPPHNAVARAIYGEGPLTSLGNAFLQPQTKRKAYFAFRFADIMRVNNVRKAWCIDHPDSPTMRSFWDRSIWGKSEAQEPESLKALMRDAVIHSSAVCVLVGTNTWQGRWVKYEIARAVADVRSHDVRRLAATQDAAHGHREAGKGIDRLPRKREPRLLNRTTTLCLRHLTALLR
jgi:hypothetical protein